jgi:transcriptional regulator with XRE-family HTH domain
MVDAAAMSPDASDPALPESLGRRIAEHRAKLGWTQQELADRLAVSRVAVSHLEAGMSTPGERTVALLAGLFKVEPHELVADTAYPTAKADRLPVVVARHTEVELQLALLDNDLVWLEERSGERPEGDATSGDRPTSAAAVEVLVRWQARLSLLADVSHDRHERDLLAEAQARVTTWLDAATRPH